MKILTVDHVATRFSWHILQDFHLLRFVAPSNLGSVAVKVPKKLQKMLRKNIKKRLTNEKMRHVKEMSQVYIAFVKAMILLIELGTGLTEICRLPVMKAIWYWVET
jgi:hypothetical protein